MFLASDFKDLVVSNRYFNELLTNPIHHNKCVGVAKNFFNKALEANQANPEVVRKTMPSYPWMFSKPFSILQSAEERDTFKIGPNNG